MTTTIAYKEIIVPQTKQYSIVYVSLMRTIRFFQIAILLHIMAVLGVLVFIYAGKAALAFLDEGKWLLFGLFAYFSLYGLTLPFFAEFDARSRYQNYKLAKDKLYEYGFQDRVMKPFMYSRCQRDAVQIAANNLNYHDECKAFFSRYHFKWYHVLPRIIIMEPKRLFTKSYWKHTLFVARYKSKYFLW